MRKYPIPIYHFTKEETVSNPSNSGSEFAANDYWMSRRNHLFVASCVALIVTAMSFSIRADIMATLTQQFNLTNEQLGWVVGTAFWGFTLAMIIGGPLCDIMGMGRLLLLAFIGHATGILLTIFATGFWTLFFGTLAIGLANGFVEAACNPLLATLYPDQKIKRLNLFHAWFPGGQVIGGVVAFFVDRLGANQSWQPHVWQVNMATMALPLIIYGAMFIGRKFPETERVASGVSTAEMYKECIRPAFLLFVFCMLMTAATELGPQQWFPNILTLTTGVTGILFLIWITGLMAVGRNFTGFIVQKISPVALMITCACFAAVGLFMISSANSAAPAFFSATLFAIGVCFFWPTMLGMINERFPKTGALGLAIMGGLGMLSSSFAQPIIGAKFDNVMRQSVVAQAAQWEPAMQKWIALNSKGIVTGIPHNWQLEFLQATRDPTGAKAVKLLEEASEASSSNQVLKATLKPAERVLAVAQKDGGAAAIRQVVILPLILICIFSGIYMFDKAHGGYKKVHLESGT